MWMTQTKGDQSKLNFESPLDFSESCRYMWVYFESKRAWFLLIIHHKSVSPIIYQCVSIYVLVCALAIGPNLWAFSKFDSAERQVLKLGVSRRLQNFFCHLILIGAKAGGWTKGTAAMKFNVLLKKKACFWEWEEYTVEWAGRDKKPRAAYSLGDRYQSPVWVLELFCDDNSETTDPVLLCSVSSYGKNFVSIQTQCYQTWQRQ